jgi:hypothetical protein
MPTLRSPGTPMAPGPGLRSAGRTRDGPDRSCRDELRQRLKVPAAFLPVPEESGPRSLSRADRPVRQQLLWRRQRRRHRSSRNTLVPQGQPTEGRTNDDGCGARPASVLRERHHAGEAPDSFSKRPGSRPVTPGRAVMRGTACPALDRPRPSSASRSSSVLDSVDRTTVWFSTTDGPRKVGTFAPAAPP